jgi:hypothetical protein
VDTILQGRRQLFKMGSPDAYPAPDPARPAPQAPPPLVVGAALPVDGAASGNPVNLRVALSANGDGFAVWQADDGTRRNLWANRYRATTAAWGDPVNIEASGTDIDDFDLTVDTRGNAVVAWHEVPAVPAQFELGVVMSARFDAGAGAWAMPVLLNANSFQPRLASGAAGAVLAVYAEWRLVLGRFFDTASGTWQPEAMVEQNNTGTGFSSGPVALLDSGNALAAWVSGRLGVAAVGSNYFSAAAGGWDQLPPDDLGPLGGVPGSFRRGALENVQLAATTGGNFLVAWQAQAFEEPEGAEILTSRFTSSTRTWTPAQTLIPNNAQNVRLQRIGSNADGNVLVLWTESEGTRTALKSIRVGPDAVCTTAHVVDSAVGGGAARADLGVDPQGNAIAIWQQFEGGRIDDGSRSNIAVNRFDGATGAWVDAVFAETQTGNAISPRASASGGQALLGWIQAEDGGNNRVKAVLQSLSGPPAE